MAAEPIDLGEALAADVEQNYPQRVLLGPADSNPFRAFGPGTTAGGRAEAGWREIGTIADDGIAFGDPSREPVGQVRIPTTHDGIRHDRLT